MKKTQKGWKPAKEVAAKAAQAHRKDRFKRALRGDEKAISDLRKRGR
jgi:hypothetical protein